MEAEQAKRKIREELSADEIRIESPRPFRKSSAPTKEGPVSVPNIASLPRRPGSMKSGEKRTNFELQLNLLNRLLIVTCYRCIDKRSDVTEYI